MRNPKNVVNLVVASLLLVVVTSGGILVSRSVNADIIYPGYATAKIPFVINSQDEQDVNITAKFAQKDPSTDKYNFKSRVFHVYPGKNNISWTIKRIEPGTKVLTLSADTGTFVNSQRTLYLNSDELTSTSEFDLTLGELIIPVKPLPTQTEVSAQSQQGYADSQLSATASPAASI
jgi:hypothetical protein